MNHYFSKTLIRWGLAFVLFYGAILDLKETTNFPKFIDFYFIVLALWLFWGKKILYSGYLTFLTFSLVSLWKMFVFGFSSGYLDFGLVLISLALIGLLKNR
ncbi:MAG: hypothetical protein KatS3mg093_264 [Candidatus Parcubacteria bacterium]|nr:MAG: hypothetical protein KatS3mg093_264 [Candidatus Parcubacteria bacterium]